MIISKDSNNNWTPVATGNGTFVGTKAAFDAVKDDLPDNTVAYTTDDGESVTDEITDGDMRAVTSNAVYDELYPATPSTPTPITTGVCGVVTWSSCTITRYGKLVQFTINNLQIPNGASGQVGQTAIATGFPPAELRTYIPCKNIASNSAAFLVIANNGNVGQLYIDNGMNTNGAVTYFSGMYIARD